MANPILALTLLLVVVCVGILECFSKELGELGYDPKDLASDQTLLQAFHRWLAKHGKKYSHNLDEQQTRFEIFKQNLQYIHSHNQRNLSYSLGLNKFADLTDEEFKSSYLGGIFRPINASSSIRYHYSAQQDELPESVDWRRAGAVTPVKNQGRCGSCWAFSTAASIEGINQIVTKQLISLSEQQLVDCVVNNHGCKGGWMGTALQYVRDNGGIASEQSYPYEGSQSTCRANQQTSSVATIDGYEQVPRNDEASLKKAVANQPVAVTIEGSGTDFKLYHSGIFTGPCGTRQDHAVAIVGYGTAEMDYWIAKNSWDTDWGEQGYIRLQRNVNDPSGLCGIAMHCVYPTKNN